MFICATEEEDFYIDCKQNSSHAQLDIVTAAKSYNCSQLRTSFNQLKDSNESDRRAFF